MSAANLSRFKTFIVIINVLAAVLALANIAAMSTRVVDVEPVEDTMIWSLDILNRRMLMQADINIKNNAVYDIRDIDIDALLYLKDGTPILEYKREGMVVPSISNQNIHFTVLLDISEEGIHRMANLLVEDDTFFLDIGIFATYLWGLGWFSMNQTLSFQWTSPMKGVVTDFLTEYGPNLLIEGAKAAMETRNKNEFFNTINAPEIYTALVMAGIDAQITEVNVTDETAHICFIGEYSESIYRIDLTIPFSDVAATTIYFIEVVPDA